MKLKNNRVTLEIADNSGVITALRDESRNLDFIQCPPKAAFRVTVLGEKRPREITAFERVQICPAAGGVDLCWHLEQEIVLRASIRLDEDGVTFTSSAVCGPQTSVTLVEYPIIGGLGRLGEDTRMIHSFATGILVRNPLDNLSVGEGIRYAPYPESFSGATMQFYAYYGVGRGGLCVMAQDGESHQKWLNFYRAEEGMEATLMYGYEEIGPGKAPAAPYPFRIRFMEGRNWEEAAALYKAWATRQRWCAQGPIARREHCEWLMRKVGLTTFGVNAGQDRARYIRRYHEDVKTSVFHVLGPDWTNTPQTFYGENPGGLPDWVPTRFNQETLAAIREVGDYYAPFEFDMMAHPGKADSAQVEESRHCFPAWPFTYSRDRYHFSMLCPCQPYTRYVHTARDVQVVREAGADGMYYDISANNLLHICLSEQHDHPKGGGHVLTEAYSNLYRETKEACAKEKGQYFPVGTEMMNEVFLPVLDYYQARAGGRPCAALELEDFSRLIKSAEAELIPLFAWVYHEYGAVRMDGWGKLVEEVGDLFYDAAAKIYLWGGLYELNYEYSPAEALDGEETRGEDHYYRFRPFGYEYSYGRARYLRQFAALRTGAGNRYLAYGEMLESPAIRCPQRVKHYHHYNHGEREIFGGDVLLPAVRASAYRSCDDQPAGYAIFLANTELDAQNISLSLDAAAYPGVHTATLIQDFDPDHEPARVPLGELPEDGTLTLRLDLPPRKVVMIEIS